MSLVSVQIALPNLPLNQSIMAKVTGIGGIFLRCADKAASIAWYEKHLGIKMETWGGAQFDFDKTPAPEGASPYSLLSFFKADSEYFGTSKSSFMLNLRVDNLAELLVQLRADGIELQGEPIDEDYGKFAWIMDPDGNKIELFEQI